MTMECSAVPEGHKKCTKCGEVKALAEYYDRGNSCKECQRRAARAWVSENRARWLANQKAWRVRNREWVKTKGTIPSAYVT